MTLPLTAPDTVTVSVVDVAAVTVPGISSVPPLGSAKTTLSYAAFVEKFVPVIVIVEPGAPWPGEKPVIVGGGGVMRKLALVVAVPPDVATLIGPVVAPVGTVAMILVVPGPDNGDAFTPLNVTVLFVTVAAKFVPLIVTDVPTGPWSGLNVEIVGFDNATELLPCVGAVAVAEATCSSAAALSTGWVVCEIARLEKEHRATKAVAIAATAVHFDTRIPFVSPTQRSENEPRCYDNANDFVQ
jgi:hypothetical protein